MTILDRVNLREGQSTPRRRSRAIWLSAVLAPALTAIVMIAVLGIAHVENGSMAPTLGSGELVVFDRVSSPSRGDIVLFSDTQGWSPVAGATLVKRVVGVAGDTVVCCEAGTGRLLVNDAPLDESYVDGQRPGGVIPFRVSVPEGTVWVMGDNRAASVDSRFALNDPSRGGVAIGDIRGVVRIVW